MKTLFLFLLPVVFGVLFLQIFEPPNSKEVRLLALIGLFLLLAIAIAS